MKYVRIWLASCIVAGVIVGGISMASADRSGPPSSTGTGPRVGQVVGHLDKTAAGCRSNGRLVGVSGQAAPGESGTVTLDVDPNTCEVKVASVTKTETAVTRPGGVNDIQSGSSK